MRLCQRLVQFEVLSESKCHHSNLNPGPTQCQGEAAVCGGGVIFLERCHHNGMLIDSSTTTPCLTPEALNPLTVPHRWPTKDLKPTVNAYSFPTLTWQQLHFLVAHFPWALLNAEMQFHGFMARHFTHLHKHYVSWQKLYLSPSHSFLWHSADEKKKKKLCALKRINYAITID